MFQGFSLVPSPAMSMQWALLVSNSDLFALRRCLRPLRRGAHREPPGEVPVRARRVLPHPVPQPAHAVRQVAVAATLPSNCLVAGDRAAVFRQTCGEDAYRDPHQRHASIRIVFQLALHELYVTQRVATARRAVDTPGPRRSPAAWRYSSREPRSVSTLPHLATLWSYSWTEGLSV
ncbi:hypothetical protein FOCC_FOCC000421 [Frankliniella occidentalis]|nr:hypothetical protein FOCC_FOCC000421 [Frankliniella occidentalis]